ncbi:nuclear factor 7, brain-like [Dendrobium catenatum]|uniref:E3 ubiquitin-protein ligase MUL1 n=1 Tax=Dendrobium catenatum TaxID=906689 RepID=A0A2I0WZF7_9ASPA|nr:nuclear factor 7, brain-like [Dendrobium catenatum]PKU81050.1 E3 ubiquitin-protein ligase MUL1 [Dendrobium catenatum]
MAQTSIRQRRTTLLEQISMMEPTNLRDLLNMHEEDSFSVASRPGGRAVTLASILESEKRGERRLLDILREEGESSGMPPETAEERAIRVPLMTLMELTDELGGDDTTTTVACSGGGSDAVAEEMVCCVCLVRKKGAAFIPCGHTYCRVCSRELWAVRGCCPLCNGVVADVLDIF